ncbi:DUF2735 domain-containing protein [Oryzicola mucosus]|uniref:DUF2735 domain-containing protein n=1 Tax=Oryzicola mucosus TaxID=2767425 RepID=A0A8J6PXP8_9HYPH|nr:DUF2735 domain-containing protein [Oryzicola mucosus]MBD0416243.1 DUF2735 domain-containing protein [Oryzicola mucosus]
MTANIQRESAKIFAFPKRTRPTADRFQGQCLPVTDLLVRRSADFVDIDGWYHEAALDKDDPSRSH